MSALAELRTIYGDRPAPPDAAGVVGADVPRELIEAAGNVPWRLAPVAGVDTSFADRVLGPGVDEAVRAILAALLEGAYPVERVVICHDGDHTVRLYTSLRRLKPGVDLWFVDLLHLPRESTYAYDRAQLHKLAQWLGGDLDLASAIAAANRTRALGDAVRARRRAGLLSGADALALLGAGTVLPSAPYAALLEEALAELPATQERTPVFMHGSDHYDDTVYAAIDALGATVVGETHSWGEALLAGRVGESGDPVEALVRHYARQPRVRAPEDAVHLAWIRRGDEARLWSVPGVRVVRSLDELREALA